MRRQRSVLGQSQGTALIEQNLLVRLFVTVCADVMAASALIDTGAILAILDRDEPWHGICVDAFRQLDVPLVTSQAILTEVFHLIGETRGEMEAAWKFIRSGALAVATIEHTELPYLHELMSRYWDRPMDYADATLVYLAKRESISTVLTIDHADFATYRIDGRRAFRIFPEHRP